MKYTKLQKCAEKELEKMIKIVFEKMSKEGYSFWHTLFNTFPSEPEDFSVDHCFPNSASVDVEVGEKLVKGYIDFTELDFTENGNSVTYYVSTDDGCTNKKTMSCDKQYLQMM